MQAWNSGSMDFFASDRKVPEHSSEYSGGGEDVLLWAGTSGNILLYG